MNMCIIHLLQPNNSNLQNQAKQSQVAMDRKLILSFHQKNDIIIIHLLQPNKSNLQNQAKQSQVEMDAHFSIKLNWSSINLSPTKALVEQLPQAQVLKYLLLPPSDNLFFFQLRF